METGSACVRQGDGERRKNFRRRQSETGRDGCCGMLVPERVGRAGFDTVSYVLMLEEVARVFTALSTALGVTNSRCSAAAAVWHRRAKEEIFAAHGHGRNAWRILFNGAGCGFRRRGNSSARRAHVGDCYKLTKRNLGDERQRRWRAAVFAKTDPDAGGKGISAFWWNRDSPAFRAGGMRTRWAAVVAVGGNFAE